MFCINCRSKKRSIENKRTQKKQRQTQSLNEYLFEKRQERKNYKVTSKTITADRIKSMFSGNCKTVDGSVAIEVGIMNTSKESLKQ